MLVVIEVTLVFIAIVLWHIEKNFYEFIKEWDNMARNKIEPSETNGTVDISVNGYDKRIVEK